jgi:hypothetical protein
MPIGSSKLGVLGAGLVPGGTETFNAPGTFSIPPGVKKVSITGKGATGNPGNAGNPGNPGNPGTGGSGGGSGITNYPFGAFINGKPGGLAYKNLPAPTSLVVNCPAQNIPLGRNVTSSNCYAIGGWGRGEFPAPQLPAVGVNGQAGRSGNAGTAGNPGNTGNAGQPSSGLCNTFPGGCGGNAGVAGAAGTGGTGGAGGNAGNDGSAGGNGGTGGTGGGNGGNGLSLSPVGCRLFAYGAMGGGGAGSVNSGQSGSPATPTPSCPNMQVTPSNRFVIGGQGNVTAPLPNDPYINQNPASTTSLMGGGTLYLNPGRPPSVGGTNAMSLITTGNNLSSDPLRNRNAINNICPAPLRPDALRAGGGGGGQQPSCAPPSQPMQFGGGGGGGGRGNAGNAGGGSPTPTGAAGTPQTFNCVPVTPGGTAPITVGTPGGQVVISWNPQ